MNVDELAESIALSIGSHEGDGQRLRLVRQFIADVPRANVQPALLGERPRTTNDPRWDALLAGVAEDLALQLGIPVPAWTVEPSRFLTEWWFVTSIPELHATALVETPAAIANRGVFIRRASLENV